MQCKHTYSSFLSWDLSDPMCQQVAFHQVQNKVYSPLLTCFAGMYGYYMGFGSTRQQRFYNFVTFFLHQEIISDYVVLVVYFSRVLPCFLNEIQILFLHFYYIIVNI